jgi:beta-lactamase regulating signal transducer with metallopeptidase domain
VFTAVYLLGIVLVSSRFVIERFLIERMVRRSIGVTDPQWSDLVRECAERVNIRQNVSLLRSSEETMPMALGIRHAMILIPAIADTWSEDRRQAVLLHEMSHLVRHDVLTQMFAAAACAFYWIHPGMWWIARRLRIERELACDDRVLSVGTNAGDYADHLLELAYALRSGRSVALAVSMSGAQQLEGRLRALLDATRNRAIPALRSRLAGIAILIVLLVPLAAARISSHQATGKAEPGRLQLTRYSQAAATPVPAVDVPGTWEIRTEDQSGIVHVRLREGDGSYSSNIDLNQVAGIPAGLTKAEGPVQFNVQRDAGTFAVEGIIRSGVGAGTYTFTPSPAFADDLARRGLERPTPGEQRLLARADIGFAFFDELSKQGYSRPAHLTDLVRAAQRGVSLAYLRDMGRWGYHFGNLDALIELRGRGVSPEFIQELASEGLKNLSRDDLLRLRGSGVDGDFIGRFRSLGYSNLSLDSLIQLRQHGVDPEYVQGLAELGYQKLSLDTLFQLRNHGVDPEYVSGLRSLGYDQLSLDKLIELRNHGVDPEYTRDLGALGYPHLALDALIELRNHGVDPEYVRELQNLGYTGLKLEDFVRMRNAGVSPDQIRNANTRAGKTLSVDDLVAWAARGWR